MICMDVTGKWKYCSHLRKEKVLPRRAQPETGDIADSGNAVALNPTRKLSPFGFSSVNTG